MTDEQKLAVVKVLTETGVLALAIDTAGVKPAQHFAACVSDAEYNAAIAKARAEARYNQVANICRLITAGANIKNAALASGTNRAELDSWRRQDAYIDSAVNYAYGNSRAEKQADWYNASEQYNAGYAKDLMAGAPSEVTNAKLPSGI